MDRLRALTPVILPERLYALLAWSNGGEGPLPVQPFNFCLDSIEEIIDAIEQRNYAAGLEGFVVFGGNGGGEYIAFDTRSAEPWPVVVVDMVVGADSAERIAPDLDRFIEMIGVEGA